MGFAALQHACNVDHFAAIFNHGMVN